MTKWRKEKEKMYCDQATRIRQKSGPSNRPLAESMKQSYAYTQKAFNTPEFAIKLDAYTQPGDAVVTQKTQVKQRPGERKQGLVEYLEPIGESTRRDQDVGIQDSSSRSKPTTQQSKVSQASPTSKGSIKHTGHSVKQTDEPSYVGRTETASQHEGASAASSRHSASSQKSEIQNQSPHALARALIAEATSGYFKFKKEAKKQAAEIEA